MASHLLEEFGSLAAVLTARPDRLLRAAGGDQSVVRALKKFHSAMRHALEGEIAEKPLLSSTTGVLEYLRFTMAFAPVEQVRVLHLNIRNMLIRDEIVSEGTIDEASIYVREIIGRALDLGSTSIILAHNHPGGDPAPSRADIHITRKISEAGKPLGVWLTDHIIVASEGHSSFRAMGLL